MEFKWKDQNILRTMMIILAFLHHVHAHPEDDSHLKVAEEVHAGVILDMRSWEGKIVNASISMAVSDFYSVHSHYRTRLVLHTRDSKGEPLLALSSALDALDGSKVKAIIGAQTQWETKVLAELGERSKVPIISFFELSTSQTSKHYPFFVQFTQDETIQVKGIVTMIETFKWKDVILIHDDSDYQTEIIPRLVDMLRDHNNIHIAYKSTLMNSFTDDRVFEELCKLKEMHTKIFIVHLSKFLMSSFFLNAEKAGMMSKGHVWIMTTMSTNLLHSMDSSVIKSMQGVLGFKTSIPDSRRLNNFTARVRRKFYMEEEDPNMDVIKTELSPLSLWAYDGIWSLAKAIEKASEEIKPGFKLAKLDGQILMNEITKIRFEGLSGEIEIRNGKLKSNEFEIVNVIGKGERRVGIWGFPDKKIRRQLSSENDLFEGIIWPGGTTSFPKAFSLSSTRSKKLLVGVPVNKGFEELVDVAIGQGGEARITGFCIDVFEAAIKLLDYEANYEFIPFQNYPNWTYNDLLDQVYIQRLDAAAGDLSILANRSKYVDFTIPFTDVGVGILAKDEKRNKWIFLKPLSTNLWIASGGFFVMTGIVVWLLERGMNEEFQGSPSQQIGTLLWYSFSTLVFAHRERLLNNLSRFVVIVWVFLVLTLTSSYTATLSSMMTVKQLQLNQDSFIGYQKGSLLAKGATINLNFKDFRLKPYNSREDYAEALSRGSKHGGVSAIIDEIPYIKSFLSQYPDDYYIAGTMSITNGFGFAFPKGSQMAADMSRAIETLREEGTLAEIEKKWYHQPTFMDDKSSTNNNPNALTFTNFQGLFIVSGLSSSSALLIFLLFRIHENWNAFKEFILSQSRKIREYVKTCYV